MSGLTRRLRRALPPRRRRALLLSISVIVVFALALVFWVGHNPESDSATGPLTPSSPTTTDPLPGASVSATPRATASGTSNATGTEGLSLPPLPPLPGNSTDIRNATHGVHSVTLKLTSDKAILRMAYVVRQGSPPSSYKTYLESPVSITTTAHGDGVLAEVAAQSGLGAKSITCSVSIDGVLKSTRTVKGAFAVAFCLA